MKEKHITEFLPDYLDGELTGSESARVEQHLETCSVCRQELQDLKILMEAFQQEKQIEPSASLQAGFTSMLENEKRKLSEEVKVVPIHQEKNRFTFRSILKVAAVISLILCSYLLGKFHQSENPPDGLSANSEVVTEQTEMLALLEDASASKRIQGVNYFEEIEDPDEEIIKALTDRMFNDENKNVRLTAVEALGKFTSSEKVKDELITALSREKDPVIQIAIIQILVKIQEKKAVEPMKKLLEQEATEPFVKEQIKALLPSIT